MSDLQHPGNFEEPLCAEVGTEIFFKSDKDESGYLPASANDYSMARKICNECIHKFECAQWGVENEIYGFWGGLSPKERINIRRGTPIGVAINRTY